MLLPTVFLGLEFLAGPALDPGVLEGAALLSCALERLGVLASAALGGFLVASGFEADLGASGLDFVVDGGRVRGGSGFLAAGFVTSEGGETTGNVRQRLHVSPQF